MMEPVDRWRLPEDILWKQRNELEWRVKKQRWVIIALSWLSVALAATTVALAVVHALQVKQCGPYVDSAVTSDPDVPQAPPMGRRSAVGELVVIPVVRRTPPLTAPSSKDTIDSAPLLAARHAPSAPYPISNSTNGSSPDAGEGRGQCDLGSVWGGRELDGLDHVYMSLMQKALSVSDPGVAGEITDYYHTALQSIFLCGESMELGQLELVAACKFGYVGEGDEVECDEGGSYGSA